MTNRDRIVIGVVLAALAVAGYWMLALKPRRDQAAKLGTDISAAHQRLDQAQTDLHAGEAARTSYAANYTAVARLGKAVPSDDDVPSLVYQLDSTAGSTGVDFRSVKVTSGAGATPAPPAQTTSANAAASTSDNAKGASSSSSSSTSTTSTSTPATPAAPTQAATATLPPGAVVGPAGLSAMPFSFSFAGSFFHLSSFMSHLERYVAATANDVRVSGRLLTINGIALTADQGGFPHMKASIAAMAYLVPAEQGTLAGATPQGPPPAGSTTQPVSSSTPSPPTAPATVKP